VNGTYQRRTAPTPERRGAVQRFNDGTLEYVTLLFRVSALILGAFIPVAIFAWIWSGAWRWGVTLAVDVVMAAACVYLGFWTFGNEEWRHGDPDGR
jgi:fatty acid desaturase